MSSDTAHLSEPQHDCSFRELKRLVIETTGLSYYADKDEDLCGRIQRRLAALGGCTWSAYLQLLQNQETARVEWDHLVEELTVGETSFFRHPELFQGLRERALPDILSRNRASRRLRIWSAGCSTGAEAYSVSILLAREYPEEFRDWSVSILGTDINRKFLNQAREGSFAAWDFRGSEAEQIQDCFIPRGNRFVIRPEFQRHVRFAYHNLIRDPIPREEQGLGAFDLILCRNVLIYFDAETNKRVVRQLYEGTTAGGWLLVGHAEPNIELFRDFTAVNVPGAVLYQKLDQPVSDVGPGINGLVERRFANRRGLPVTMSTQISRTAVDRRRTLGTECPPGTERAAAGQRLQRRNAPEISDHVEKSVREAPAPSLRTALHQCEAQTACQPMEASSHLRLAMLRDQTGDHARAESSIRRAIYLEPTSAFAQYLLGVFEQRRGRKKIALRAYARVLSILNGRPDSEPIPDGEQLVVADLRRLVSLQQEALNEP